MIAPGGYQGRTYAVEPDASAASYFFAAAAITGGRVRVAGLGTRSLQGDLRLVHILAQMGCECARARTSRSCAGPRRGSCGRRRRHGRAVRHRADAGGGRAVRAHADPGHRHRLHPPQGDRPDRRGGHASSGGSGCAPRRSPTVSWSTPARPGRRGRHLRRPPHGDELRAARPGAPRHRHQRPGLRRARRSPPTSTCSRRCGAELPCAASARASAPFSNTTFTMRSPSIVSALGASLGRRSWSPYAGRISLTPGLVRRSRSARRGAPRRSARGLDLRARSRACLATTARPCRDARGSVSTGRLYARPVRPVRVRHQRAQCRVGAGAFRTRQHRAARPHGPGLRVCRSHRPSDRALRQADAGCGGPVGRPAGRARSCDKVHLSGMTIASIVPS